MQALLASLIIMWSASWRMCACACTEVSLFCVQTIQKVKKRVKILFSFVEMFLKPWMSSRLVYPCKAKTVMGIRNCKESHKLSH